MAIEGNVIYTLETFNGAVKLPITDEMSADKGESYLTDGIQCSGVLDAYSYIGSPAHDNFFNGEFYFNLSGGAELVPLARRWGFWLRPFNNGYVLINDNGGGSSYIGFRADNTYSSPNVPAQYSDGQLYVRVQQLNPTDNAYFSTNIPIFETRQDLLDYIAIPINQSAQTQLEKAINYKEDETSPDGQEFRLEVQWTISTWTNDNQPTVSGQPYIQGVKGKITDGKFALYKIAGIDDGKLKYGIKNTASFYDLEYTTDGVSWTPTDTFPFEFIYRPRINELGTFGYALSLWNTDVPIWKDEDDADDYINDDKPITDAENWDKISPQYPPQNPTGDPDDESEMGEVYTRAFFSQQYICGTNALQEISNALFDTTSGGVWEDIKKGLEMYGDTPVDDIQGCMFFPLDLNQVFTSTQAQNYIYFGGYRFELQNSSVNKIIYPNGVYDFGSFDIKPSFGMSYRDYAPYSRLFCYLAYIGWVELDIARYIGKTANIKYYIDTRTGGCLACIFANGVLVDYFNGQMGVSMPITATDFVAYANAQIQTLLTGASGVKGNAGSMFSNAQGMINAGVGAGAVAGAMLPVATAMVGMQGAKTLYGLTQNNINNFNKTIGSSTSMLNQYLPQYCMMMWEIQDSDETPNERSLQGYPSNASNILSAFNGYLEVDAVNLSCAYATDNERAEIIAYLKSGVYI